jgi:hypothetical protein
MTVIRNRMFLEGIAVGGIGGIILGSIIAFIFGESRMEAVRHRIEKRFPSRQRVPFEYLSQ